MKKDKFSTYNEAHKYFYGRENHRWDLGLENISNFLQKIGNPQEKLNIIQIAGTNGKGSVSSFLTDILMEKYDKVGRYNSPAVFEERENITINNIPITGEEFVSQVNELYEYIELAEREEALPTIFELETIMALNYFYKKSCDIVILETGLGGRDDATNVSKGNILSVFTSISLDHMEYLGSTVEEIAHVKAGIIKKNSKAVIGINNEAVTRLLKAYAKKNNTKADIVNPLLLKGVKADITGQEFIYKGISCKIKLLGKNQLENAAAAIEAAMALDVPYKAITEGIKKTCIRGRFHIANKSPLIVLDGAHNPDAALRLRENIEEYLSGFAIVAVMGVFRDKDYKSIINIMKPYLKRAVAVSAKGQRALAPKELRREILAGLQGDNKEALCSEVYEAESLTDGINMAAELMKKAGEDEGKPPAMVIFGSLSYLGDIYGIIKNTAWEKSL
mgnify:CR=1 FL=1